MPGHQLSVFRSRNGRVAEVVCSCKLKFGLMADEGQQIGNADIVFQHFMLDMDRKAWEQRHRQRPS